MAGHASRRHGGVRAGFRHAVSSLLSRLDVAALHGQFQASSSLIPAITGFSASSLFFMRSFAQAWRDDEPIVQQSPGLSPRGRIIVHLDKVDSSGDRNAQCPPSA